MKSIKRKLSSAFNQLHVFIYSMFLFLAIPAIGFANPPTDCESMMLTRQILDKPRFGLIHNVQDVILINGLNYYVVDYNYSNKMFPFNQSFVGFAQRNPHLSAMSGTFLNPNVGTAYIATTDTLNFTLDHTDVPHLTSGIRFRSIDSGDTIFSNDEALKLLSLGLHGFATRGSWFYHDRIGSAHVVGAVYMPKVVFAVIKAKAKFLMSLQSHNKSMKNAKLQKAINQARDQLVHFWDSQTEILGVNIMRDVEYRDEELYLYQANFADTFAKFQLDFLRNFTTEFKRDPIVLEAIKKATQLAGNMDLIIKSPNTLFNTLIEEIKRESPKPKLD